MSQTGLSARIAAVKLLHGVLFENLQLSELTVKTGSIFRELAPPEAARANSLALMVLRNLSVIDHILDGFLKKEPPLKVRNILRVGAAELLVDNVPAHAAINSAVSMVKASRKTAHLSGLVNAVCRNMDRGRDDIWPPKSAQELPKSMRNALAQVYGENAVIQIEAVQSQEPPLDITLKVAADTDAWAQKLGADVLGVGSLRLRDWGQVSALDGFDEGAWWVQDYAASLPVKMLGDVAGKRVLDLCAAPGGKTLQLAAAGAEVVALDISEQRLKRLTENLERMKLSADVVASNAFHWTPDAPFDAILLDAPCSATGTIRRHPDLPYLKSDNDNASLIKRQAKLLEYAFGWLAVGGSLVYSTCSIFPDEGEEQLENFLRRMPNAAFEAVKLDAYGVPDDWMSDGALRSLPHYWAQQGGVDGFFAAKITKKA